jgi:hypothetical protein
VATVLRLPDRTTRPEPASLEEHLAGILAAMHLPREAVAEMAVEFPCLTEVAEAMERT